MEEKMNENLTNWGYEYNAMRYEIQREQTRLAEEIRQDERELYKVKQKAKIREQAKLRGMKERQRVKDQIEEARRSVYENVSISGDGKIEMKTENLSIEPSSRILSDLCSPELILLRNGNELNEKIFLVVGFVKNKKIEMFFLPERCGNGTYLLRKFSTAGVSIYAPAMRAKAYVGQLLRLLVSNNQETEILPENPGWMLLPDGKLKLVEEGELLWSEAKKMSL